jgi:hypothetical protein
MRINIARYVSMAMGTICIPRGIKTEQFTSNSNVIYTSTEDDKKALFPTSESNHSMINVMSSTNELAITNSFHGKNEFARKSLDKMCPGCGKYGHSVLHKSCNFYANYLLASK